MASYDYYINQYNKTHKDAYDKQVQKVKDLANETLTGTLNLIDQNTQSSIKPLEQKKDALPQQYQSYFDANEIQNLVNQRQLEERMANLGLTDSGLNRTQETALAIQKSNTAAAYNQKKQAAILSLDNQINEIIASGNLKKQEATLNSKSALQSQLYSLEDAYNTNKQTYASSMEQADKQAEAERIKARKEYDKERKNAFSSLLKDLEDASTDYQKLEYIYDYMGNYEDEVDDISFLNDNISRALSFANIPQNTWRFFIRARQGFYNK